ncbi:4'-phosphopantetheinyl transferase superfamily protein [Streptomyces sp. NPDC002773]|uniref:4'-phosphopantetheinyl transferase family protein n=1 Tax=Streptomyces sp. NPDC002773 TaxID=3154430 RepID=UPI00331E9A1D
MPLVSPPDGTGSLAHLLDSRERAECERIPPGLGRIRYTVSHAAYRTTLARYCGVSPHAIRWRRTAQGKPFLDGLPDAPHSSLSHAGDLAAIAVSRRRGVGVDLAGPGPAGREAALAARFFTPEEAGAVAAGESFPRLWARKEACVKAVGATFVDGLRLPVLRQGPLRCEDGPLRGQRWWLSDVSAPAPYRAALALRGDTPFTVRVHGRPGADDACGRSSPDPPDPPRNHP